MIASNITPPSAQLGRQSIYFFPDAAFIIDGKQVGAIGYADLSVGRRSSKKAIFRRMLKLLGRPGSI